MPVTELRVVLTIAVIYAIEPNIPISLIFLTIILTNILIIFFIFYFLDNINSFFMKFNFYNRIFGRILKKFQKKVNSFEKRYKTIGLLALIFFVAIPFPGTGVWSGSLISWILDLNRKKSIAAISLGVVIAGILVLFGTLGFINLFS